MATPDFVVDLRRQIGTAPLPLVGATAVVVRNGEVLLGRRSDNGRWEPVSGIVDPGEEPADAAVRECLEEAGIVVRAERLALVQQIPRVVYANGDQVDYLDLVFRCAWVSGEPHPADGEMTEVAFFPAHQLPPLDAESLGAIEHARAESGPTMFRGGRS